MAFTYFAIIKIVGLFYPSNWKLRDTCLISIALKLVALSRVSLGKKGVSLGVVFLLLRAFG